MGSIAYMDFDLLIHRDETGYRAQVLNSPAGQARVTFSMPFSDQEFENLPLRMGRTRGGGRRIDSADVAAAKIFGGRLFAAVFDGEVLGCLRSSLDEASRQDAGLRIRLRLTDVPELADLAWEYLYNPTLNRFLALSVETPIVRYLDLPQRIRPLAVTPPLRVLAMISSPDDYPQLDVEQEWAKLHEALGDLEREDLVTVERLDDATLASLLPRLQRGEYHIFHFIGHGGFDQQAQDGVLILEDGKRRGRPVSGQDLGTLLRDHRPMRLAVLNACEGARTSSTDPFAGTAQSLIQQGVPAVIAMQFEITDEAAITFANAFYGAVAGGYPVDAGLAEARKAIFAQGNSLEWGTPVLYMRAPDGRIFDVKQVSNEERRELRLAALYREAQTALAREDWTVATERLQAVLSLEPTHAEAQARLHEVRQQQELATWYATGQQHYDAGQWQEALEDFRRVQVHGGNYKDVEALLATAQRELTRVRDEERRRLRLAALYREAQTALAKEDWTVATERLQAVLSLEPTHAEAQARLHEVRQQQELATWYATGQQHYDAGQWQEALEDFRRVQVHGGNYKDVEALLATAQRELTRVRDEEQRRLRLAALYREAQTVLAKEDWTVATERLQAVLSLEPTHAEAQARLHEVRQQQELATWYATGQQHYDAGQWQEALENFRQVRKRGGNYKGVDGLIVMVRRKISEEKPASNRISLLWIGVGGALALLVFIMLARWGMQRGQPELPLRWQSIAVLSGYTAPVKSAVFSPDNKWVVAASYDPTVWVWEASTGKGVAELRGHTAPVKSAVFSPDGKWIATASDDKMARVWEASTGKGVAELRGHTAPVKSAVFSPDGKWIATASDDKMARVWEASTGKVVAVLEGHTAPVRSAVFSPDGKWIATASSADPTVWVWEASTGKGVAELRGHTAPVKSAVFSPDGKWVVAASDDPTVWVWEASTGKAVAELRGHAQWVNSVVFSPDGKWVVTASDDKTARVWEASTGKAVAELRGHTAEVNSAVFSRDGKWVVTASSDGTARVWEASTGKAVAELRGHMAEVNSAVFSRDGKWVVTASSDDTARVWKASRE